MFMLVSWAANDWCKACSASGTYYIKIPCIPTLVQMGPPVIQTSMKKSSPGFARMWVVLKLCLCPLWCPFKWSVEAKLEKPISMIAELNINQEMVIACRRYAPADKAFRNCSRDAVLPRTTPLERRLAEWVWFHRSLWLYLIWIVKYKRTEDHRFLPRQYQAR